MSTINVTNITDGTDTITVSDTFQGTAKAWAYVASSGNVQRGFNVASVANGISPAIYTVTFTNAMDTTNYV